MIKYAPPAPFVFALSVFLVGLTGCITSTDLDRLNDSFSVKLQELEGTVQAQMGAMRTDLQTVGAAQQEGYRNLSEELRAAREESNEVFAKLSASEARTARLVRELEVETDELRNESQATRAIVTEYASHSARELERIVALTKELKSEIENVQDGVRQTLLGTYLVEEAALRERLRVLVKVREQLESVQPPTAEASVSNGVVTESEN